MFCRIHRTVWVATIALGAPGWSRTATTQATGNPALPKSVCDPLQHASKGTQTLQGWYDQFWLTIRA